MTDADQNELVWVGTFEPPQAKQVLDALESAGIPFEIERDDSPIRTLSPFAASLGGTFGHGAFIIIHVPKGQLETAQQIIAELFPEQS